MPGGGHECDERQDWRCPTGKQMGDSFARRDAGHVVRGMMHFRSRGITDLLGRVRILKAGLFHITIGGIMDLKNITDLADGLVEKGKAALDANQDGTIEMSEVTDAVVGRVREVVDAAGEAVENVKAGFDANGDSSVSLDEVKTVAEGVVGMAGNAIGNLVNSVMGKTGSEGADPVAVDVEVDAADAESVVDAEAEYVVDAQE